MPGMVSFFAAPQLASLSVIMTRGDRICFFVSSAAWGAAAWPLVAPALDQNIENGAGLVHGSPQPMLHPGNLERDLIQMPFVADLREAMTDLVGKLLAEFARPLSDGFVTDHDAAGGQQLLHHA
jgi:hypothetical protein